MESLQYKADEAITSWLSTAASQIFFMQLGFLCYESGFVKTVWAPSIILKNIEDTFVGILTYLAFTHTLSTSSPSLFGIISVPNQAFLINIDPLYHEEVFVAAVFATTSATIISGCVLERMKNKAYIFWCFFVILINYSFVAHWVWNPNGWLAQMGFMDGAGAVVVHSTGAVAGGVAVWKLGPRRGTLNKEGTLKPVESAERPIITAIGAFILWYGWFAFNVSSPVAAELGIGAAVGTTGLVTCISPTCASCSALLMMYWGFAKMSYDNLLGAMLAGLVGITGCCYTVNVWNAALIGLFSSPIYFISAWFSRYKLYIDDPLQIIPIHLCCGLYSCIMEGIMGNDVMGEAGLIYGGYKHFGVQVLGTLCCFAFNVIWCVLIWCIVMEKCLFRKTSIGVSILDTYLGVSLFELNTSMALEEVLSCKTNLARQMALQFHKYTVDRFNNEQFDFLLAITIFGDMMQHDNTDTVSTANIIIAMVDTYILPDAIMCVNVSGTQRAQLIKIRRQLQREVDQFNLSGATATIKEKHRNGNECAPPLGLHYKLQLRSELSSRLLDDDTLSDRIFVAVYDEVFKILLPVFSQFLQKFDKKRDIKKENVRLPLQLQPDWMLDWDTEVHIKANHKKTISSLSKAVNRNEGGQSRSALLPKVFLQNRELLTEKQLELMKPPQAQNKQSNESSPAFIIHSAFEYNAHKEKETKDEKKEETQHDKEKDDVTIVIESDVP